MAPCVTQATRLLLHACAGIAVAALLSGCVTLGFTLSGGFFNGGVDNGGFQIDKGNRPAGT